MANFEKSNSAPCELLVNFFETGARDLIEQEIFDETYAHLKHLVEMCVRAGLAHNSIAARLKRLKKEIEKQEVDEMKLLSDMFTSDDWMVDNRYYEATPELDDQFVKPEVRWVKIAKQLFQDGYNKYFIVWENERSESDSGHISKKRLKDSPAYQTAAGAVLVIFAEAVGEIKGILIDNEVYQKLFDQQPLSIENYWPTEKLLRFFATDCMAYRFEEQIRTELKRRGVRPVHNIVGTSGNGEIKKGDDGEFFIVTPNEHYDRVSYRSRRVCAGDVVHIYGCTTHWGPNGYSQVSKDPKTSFIVPSELDFTQRELDIWEQIRKGCIKTVKN